MMKEYSKNLCDRNFINSMYILRKSSEIISVKLQNNSTMYTKLTYTGDTDHDGASELNVTVIKRQ